MAIAARLQQQYDIDLNPPSPTLSKHASKPTENQREENNFNVHVVTGIDFVDGDTVSSEVVQNYQKHLAEIVGAAAQNLSLRTIKGVQVENVVVEEIGGARLRQFHKWTTGST
jgi:hypothetical protein